MATRDDGGALVCARDRAVLLFRRAGAAARLIGLSVGFGGLYLIFERLSFVGGRTEPTSRYGTRRRVSPWPCSLSKAFATSRWQ